MPNDMSPTRGPREEPEETGSPGAFQLDISLCNLPMDILPPSPKVGKKQRFSHTPMLYTALAKKAFDDGQSSNRPRRPESADHFSTLGLGGGERRHGIHSIHRLSGLLSPSKMGGASMVSGRHSAEPLSTLMKLAHIDHRLSTVVIERHSMTKSKLIGGVTKKRPELFVLEAEQRALEGEQKAMEREAFERKRTEATIHVTHLTKQCNDLKKQRVDMERELALLHDRKAALDAEAQGEEHRKAAHNALRIQDLEAKLEYWTQALREEEAYTKTLLHMKARSAADKHGRDIETAKFKDNVKRHEHDVEMLTARYHETKNERDAAEKNLSDYWEEMDMYRCRRDTRLGERRHQVEKMEARNEAMRRLAAKEEELNKEQRRREADADAEKNKGKRAHERFLAHLQEGFNKMMSISGIQTVQELEESFLTRREREKKFEKLLEENKNKINDLTDMKQALDHDLMNVKYSGSANDAERDEVEECEEEIVRVKRMMQERKMKQDAIQSTLIRVRSAFEYLAIKLGEVELEEDQVEEILAKAQAKNAQPQPAVARKKEDEVNGKGQGDDSDKSEQDVDEVKRADSLDDLDLSVQVGDEDMSHIEQGEMTLEGTVGEVKGLEGVEDALGEVKAEIKMEMKKVQDPKTGVIAKLRESIAKLEYMYTYLEERTGAIAPQTKQNAQAKASGAKNLKVTLSDAKHNLRVALQRGSGVTPRRTDDEDDDNDLEDRSTIKNKCDRLVAKKKREYAALFDEFGNPVMPNKGDADKPKK